MCRLSLQVYSRAAGCVRELLFCPPTDDVPTLEIRRLRPKGLKCFFKLRILDLKSSQDLWAMDSYYPTRNLAFPSPLTSPNSYLCPVCPKAGSHPAHRRASPGYLGDARLGSPSFRCFLVAEAPPCGRSTHCLQELQEMSFQ